MIAFAINTHRLSLRRATQEDIKPYCKQIYCNPQVMEMLPGRIALSMSAAIPRARANLLATWESDEVGPWIVRRKGSEEIIGHCGLRHWPESNDIEVLYGFTPQVWGHGYASEAAQASVDEGFSALNLQRIIAGALPENEASIKVLIKIGMEFWQEKAFHGMRIHRYTLTRSAWNRHKQDT